MCIGLKTCFLGDLSLPQLLLTKTRLEDLWNVVFRCGSGFFKALWPHSVGPRSAGKTPTLTAMGSPAAPSEAGSPNLGETQPEREFELSCKKFELRTDKCLPEYQMSTLQSLCLPQGVVRVVGVRPEACIRAQSHEGLVATPAGNQQRPLSQP